jgi:Zincin-like metallopeptidase
MVRPPCGTLGVQVVKTIGLAARLDGRWALARPAAIRRCRPQNSQVPAPADLDTLPDRLDRSTWRRGLAHGVSERLKVVGGRFLAWPERKPDDVPAERSGQPVSMCAAQVIAVRLDVGSQRAEHRRGVPVNVGQRAHGVTFARRPGAAARTQRPTSLTARPILLTLDAATRLRRFLAELPGRPSVPQKAGPRSSLTTADGIGMPGGNAITQGTLRDRVLAARRYTRRYTRRFTQPAAAGPGLSGLVRPVGTALRPAGTTLWTVRPADGRPPAAAKIRRRDRHGRGLRGPLAPPGSPLYRSRAERFDELVLAAVAQLEPRWEAELSGVEFAVEEVPTAYPPAEDLPPDDDDPVPLARLDPPWAETGDPARPARPARIVIYRRPLLARADGEDELSELVLDVVIEEFARLLGIDPQAIDPGYDDE